MTNAYDRSLALRSLAMGALVSLVVVLIVVTTDEAMGFAQRLALCAVLAPVSGALGTFGASSVARARGETRALSALGVHPSRALMGAVLGGALIGFVGAAVLASGFAELSPLFPRPAEVSVWEAEPSGGMVERARGLWLRPGGELVLSEAHASRVPTSIGAEHRFAVSIALLLLSIGGPLSLVRASISFSFARLGLLVLLLLIAIASFQFVAADRVSAWAVCASPLLLLANGLVPRYRPLLER